MNVADTSVLVYAFDADEIVKRPMAEALIDGLATQPGDSVLLWQVAGEFLNWLRKWEAAGRISAADVEVQFRDVLAAFPLRPGICIARAASRCTWSRRPSSTSPRTKVRCLDSQEPMRAGQWRDEGSGG